MAILARTVQTPCPPWIMKALLAHILDKARPNGKDWHVDFLEAEGELLCFKAFSKCVGPWCQLKNVNIGI